MPTMTRRYNQMMEKRGSAKKAVPLDEAINIVRDMAAVDASRSYKSGRSRKKFDQSIELVMHLGIDAKQADQMIRGSLSLPNGIGKTKRVIAFCDEDMVATAKEAGAIEAGGDELVARVQGGWMDFDVAVAHPKLMGKVGKLGRVLGPSGKMPSPKSGTVTPDVAQAVKDYSAGKIEFRNDSGGNIHAVMGKASFEPQKLRENVEFFIKHIQRARPTSAKGTYIKRVCLSATLTPSVTVSLE